MEKIFRIRFFIKAILLCLFFVFSIRIQAQTVSIGGVINTYAPVLGFDTTGCKARVVVTSTVGFSVGDSVLVIQMKGAGFDSTNTSNFGAVNNLNGAGNYEIAAISSITSNSIMLNGKLVRRYDLSGRVQLVSIPLYLNADVTSPLTCLPWNGSSGGVLIFNVQNSLILSDNIDVSGKGFRGGTISLNPDGSCGTGSSDFYYDVLQGTTSWNVGGAEKGEGIGILSTGKMAGRGPLVNGGGGGNKHNSGGGGGGNYTSGGTGGFEFAVCFNGNNGLGGRNLSTTYTNNVLFLGGGGGCGDQNNASGTAGENGGGIVIITANTINGNNFRISANGNTVNTAATSPGDGAGGGGGGGNIFLNINSTINSLTLTANGGGGGNQNVTSCIGPGGGGGTGAILTNLSSLAGVTSSLIPGPSGTFVTAGCASGTWGATAGLTNTVGILPNRTLARTIDAVIPISTISSASVCETQSINIPSGVTADFYSWAGPAAFSSTLNAMSIQNASLTNAGNYTLMTNSLNGCKSIITVSVVVEPSPTISIVSSSVCNGQPININPTVLGAISYTWNGPNAFSANTQSISIPVSSPASDGVYTLMVSSNKDCISSTTGTINVAVVSSISVSVVSPVCLGSPLFLMAGSGSGNLSYTWTGPGLFSSTLQNPTITAVTLANVGTYSLIASVNTCTTSKVTSSVAIEMPPVITIGSSSVCNNSTISIGVLSNSGISYNWSGPNSFSTTSQIYSLAVNSLSLAGAYNVTVTSALGCTSTAVSNLSVVPRPPASLVSNQPVCGGTVLNFTTSGATTYTLSGPNSFVTSIINPSITNVSVAASGIYTLVGNTALCTSAATLPVVIFQQPIPIISTSSQVCVPRGFQLNVTGGLTYTWTGPSGFSSTQQNPSVITSSLANAGIYSVSVEGPNGCVTNETVAISFVITPTIITAGATACIGQQAILQCGAATSYSWSGPNSFVANTRNAVVPIANNTTAGTYTVLVTSLNLCFVSATVNLSLYPPLIPTLSVPPRTCANSTITLFTSGGVAYILRGPSGLFLAGTNPTFVPVNTNYTGSYVLTATSVDGCTANAVANMTVDPLPNGKFVGQTDGCLPFCADYLYNSIVAASALSYTWTTATSFSTGPVFNFCFKNPGKYNITARLRDSLGCDNVITHSVNVRPKPDADFTYLPSAPKENIDVVYFTDVSKGDKLDFWNWFVEKNNSFSGTSKNFNCFFENAGTFPVVLTVRNEWGCWDTIIKPIVINSDFNMFVPSIFTPNGDGKNDIFQPKGSGFINYEFYVFDRWGQKLFYTKSFETGWDGTFKGTNCTDDVYTWQIKVEKTGGKTTILNGDVLLAR